MPQFRFISSSAITRAAILALFLLSCATPRVAAMGADTPSASGTFKFSLEDGLAKYIEFNAEGNSDGTATGGMTLSGPADIPDQDVDGTGDKGFNGSLSNLYIEAKFDGLVVERNRAVMSGTVTACNLGDYIGQRVLLVVEDNGDGSEDKLSWGIYKPVEMGWIPTDAELKDDNGWSLTWIATDAERDDDKGVPSKKSTVIDCMTFPLTSYSLTDLNDGEGNIQVHP